ncbi:MAG: S41 family peptidase, partial [Proteiniphilum sp.]|nr:S41 family peptidase [Proteiniphilum sp.]
TKGDKRIGYLVYHFFARDKGDDSNSYDKLLMQKLTTMKSQGINEMVLDLRYNGGGAVSSAIALSSALVKDRSTSNILVTSQYNSIIHREMTKAYGSDYNKDLFIDRVEGTTISIPALNLPRLYVLTSSWTASASEFVINGLRPYMDVILIGETTFGKNVGSITLFEEDEPNNKWGLQPIVVKYFNSKGESDFTTGFTPNYEVDEFADLYLYPFGDSNDPMLGKALSLITGSTRSSHASMLNTPFRSSQVDRTATERMLKPYRFDMQDDIRGEEIKRVIKK